MSKRRIRSSVFTLALVGMLAGLLLWSKLRLATDMPQSAYAEPEGEAPAADRRPGPVRDAPPAEPKARPKKGAGEADPRLTD